MRRFLLDTNVLLAYLRQSELVARINKELRLDSEDVEVFISVVSVGEILTIAFRSNWGEKKKENLLTYLQNLIIVDINASDRNMINAYVEIDAFSQGHHPDMVLKTSARNMGKNDLWIAATARAINASLVTTDSDFDHLANTFVQLQVYTV